VLGAEGESGSTSSSPADLSYSVIYGLYWLVSNLAERRPLLLTVDDVHWSDPPSLRFLEYLARRVGDLRVLLVLALRPKEPGAEVELLARMTADPTVTVIRPAPLSEQATRQLVRILVSSGADEAFSRACHVATGGNPFLLRELLEAVRIEGMRPQASEAGRLQRMAPGAVSRMVLLRLMRLPAQAGRLARAAALLGDDVELRRAAAVAELGERDAAEAVDALVAAGILAGGHPLRFAHPLVREAVYAEIGPGERALGHRRAARLLFETGAPPEHVAAQLLLTEPAGQDWSVSALRAAADEALRRGAPGVAAGYLRRALAEPPVARERAGLVRGLGAAEALSGDPAGLQHLREAVETAPAGRPHADIARELAQACVPAGRFEEAVETLERAIAQLGREDRELRLELEAEMASAGRLHPSTCPPTAERLKHLVPGIRGETPAERLLLASIGMQRMLDGGPPGDALALVERALSGGLLVEQTSSGPTFWDAVWVLVVADAWALAERVCEDALADARARGSLMGMGLTLSFRSHLAYRRGSVPDAESDARASLEIADASGYAFGPMALAFLLDALIERGELGEATEAVALRGFTGEIPCHFMADYLLFSRGRLRLASGDTERGIEDLREVSKREELWRSRSPSALPYRSALAVPLARVGEAAEAHALAEEELSLARESAMPSAIGIALRALGLVEEGDRSLHRLKEAVRILEASGADLELSRALVDLAATLRRARRPAAAREPLRRGLDLARRRGATALAERAWQELLAAGARPRRAALSGVEALTPSELRVAQMAARGLTNREIAQSLFVAVRTVTVHLNHAYQKLGITSRRQLAEALTPGSSRISPLGESNCGGQIRSRRRAPPTSDSKW